MQRAEASEDEEQAIDRLLGELGIRLPDVELGVDDGEDLSGPTVSPDPAQRLRPEQLREWWPFPFS